MLGVHICEYIYAYVQGEEENQQLFSAPENLKEAFASLFVLFPREKNHVGLSWLKAVIFNEKLIIPWK